MKYRYYADGEPVGFVIGSNLYDLTGRPLGRTATAKRLGYLERSKPGTGKKGSRSGRGLQA